MSGYMLGAFSLAAAVAVGSILIYDKRFAGVTRLVFSLLLLVGFLLPLGEALASLGDGWGLSVSSPELPEGEYQRVTEEAVREGIARAVADEFSLEREQIEVVLLAFDARTMKPEGIRVILSGRAALADLVGIRNYLTEGGFGDCEVRIEIG